MLKKAFSAALVLLAVAGLALLTSRGASGDGPEDRPVGGGTVPVVLDGVYHSPQQFEQVYKHLHDQGISLMMMYDLNGSLHAFTARGDARRFLDDHYSQRKPATDAPKGPGWQQGNPGLPHKFNSCPDPAQYTSYAFEHENCDGEFLFGGPGAQDCDLQDVGGYDWNDRISSAVSAISIAYLVLYEHVECAGSTLWIPGDAIYDDEISAGWWNDRASGLWACESCSP